MTEPSELLTMALRGMSDDWERVHTLCCDRATAAVLAEQLVRVGPGERAAAQPWMDVIREMHPDLAIEWPKPGGL